MEFKKYSSIENSYNNKYISKFVNQHPELLTAYYIVREKIDGANIQIVFSPNSKPRFGKRSQFLPENSNFFNIDKIWEDCSQDFEVLQSDCDYLNTTVRLYGEIAGNGIQNRVRYGNKRLFIFDMFIDDKRIDQCDFDMKMRLWGLTKYMCPVIGTFNSLNEALVVNETFNSKVLNEENNPAEGVVIRPFLRDFLIDDKELFILKKKSEHFNDKMKTLDLGKEVNMDVINFNVIYKSYINENRIKDTISKLGPIEDKKKIGEYIRFILDDAKTDFLKDHDISIIEEKQRKEIFNDDGLIFRFLKVHI